MNEFPTVSIVPPLKNRRVTVMGLGRFGGGAGVVRYLCRRGARVTVTDLRTADDLAESLAAIDECHLEALQLGGHCEDDFREADLIVVNPAVRRDSSWLDLASQAGIPQTSEMMLFWQHQHGRIIGVTGSNGKSTTAAMTHSILQAAGIPARLGGNLGGSLLDVVEDITADDWTVLELSSFQLYDLNRLPSSPQIAVVTGFAPNHLDWHGSLAEYRFAKQTILRWQTPLDTAVLNADDADVAGWTTYGRRLDFAAGECPPPSAATRRVTNVAPAMASPACGTTTSGEGLWRHGDGGDVLCRLDGREESFPLGEWVRQPGQHNLANAQAATLAALAAGADCQAVHRGLREFEGLPHRLELVGEQNGIRFVNDSLATTPESVEAALRACDRPAILLAGGYDKQIDLGPLAETILRHTSTGLLRAVALMGQTASLLEELISTRRGYPQRPGVRVTRTFEEAFTWAADQANAGDTVLLSPGCASYDWFRDFAERGERFRELAAGWKSSSTSE